MDCIPINCPCERGCNSNILTGVFRVLHCPIIANIQVVRALFFFSLLYPSISLVINLEIRGKQSLFIQKNAIHFRSVFKTVYDSQVMSKVSTYTSAPVFNLRFSFHFSLAYGELFTLLWFPSALF